MRKTMQKRILSVLLVIALAITMIPMAAYAQGSETVLEYPNIDTTLDSRPAINYSDWNYTPVHDCEVIYGRSMDGTEHYFSFSTDQGSSTRTGVQIRKSDDLTTWQYVGQAFNATKDATTGEVTSNFPEGVTPNFNNNNQFTGVTFDDLNRGTNFWAPMVFYNEDDDYYYLYYCYSSFGNRNSNLGCAKSKYLDGGWEDQGIMIQTRTGDGKGFNAIDPMVFRDKDRNIWMVYGSFFKGISVLRLNNDDPSKLLEPGTHGKCIARRDLFDYEIDDGTRFGLEGATINYIPETGYYYLCLSYDFLGNTYNTRIARSKNPDGPYEDYNGNGMIYQEVDTERKNGTKILSSYSFNNDPYQGWMGTGHCTFFKAQDGQWYLGHNSRPGVRTGQPFMNVRKILWTNDGWPIVSPELYAGETTSAPKSVDDITKSTDACNWETIVFEPSYKEKALAVVHTFNSDGTIDNDGYWTYDNGDATISFDGITATGKMIYGWDNENWCETIVFSGITADGVCVWAKRGITTEEAIEKDIAALPTIIQDNQYIRNSITLPTQGTYGTPIYWDTSDHTYLESDGTLVKRPAAGEDPVDITLTANCGGSVATFTVTIQPYSYEGLLGYYSFDDPDNLMKDDSGNGNDLINFGAVAGEGLIGGAADLAGGTEYMKLPDGLTKQENFTFASWIKFDENRTWARILDIGGGAGNNLFFCGKDGTGKYRITYTPGGLIDWSITDALPENEWQHVAFTVEGNQTLKVYLNGELVGERSINGYLDTIDGLNAFLGKSQYPADPYVDGQYDEVYFYSKVLSDEEIADLANPTIETSTFDVICETFDYWQDVTKVIVDLGANVDASAVDNDTFSVSAINYDSNSGAEVYNGPRPVTNAYVSDENGNAVDNGRYVTLELTHGVWQTDDYNDTSRYSIDGAATGYYPTSAKFYSFDMNYSVIQEKEIQGISGIQTYVQDEIKDDLLDQFALDTFTDTEDISVNYAFYTPENAQDGNKHPLMIWFHGMGEGGTALDGIQLYANRAAAFADSEFQDIMGGAYFLAPQAPDRWPDKGFSGVSKYTDTIFQLIDKLVAENPDIDTDRIYIGGLSMGGYMAWNMIRADKDYFAGAIMSAAAFCPTEEEAQLLKDVPMWIVCSSEDAVCTPQNYTEKSYNMMVAAGAENIHFTMYGPTTEGDITGPFVWDGVRYSGHDGGWIPVYNNDPTYVDDNGNTVTIFEWLSMQVKKPVIEITTDKQAYYPNEEIIVTLISNQPINGAEFFNEYGSHMGAAAIDVVESDGVYTLKYVTSIGTKGNRTISVKDYYGNDLGSFNVVITNDIAESDETPEVISAEADTRVAYVNQNFTVTVVTNKGAAKVGIYNEYGSDIGKALINKVVDGDNIIWTFNINVGSKGLRTFTVKAADTLGQWSDNSQQFKVSIVK